MPNAWLLNPPTVMQWSKDKKSTMGKGIIQSEGAGVSLTDRQMRPAHGPKSVETLGISMSTKENQESLSPHPPHKDNWQELPPKEKQLGINHVFLTLSDKQLWLHSCNTNCGLVQQYTPKGSPKYCDFCCLQVHSSAWHKFSKYPWSFKFCSNPKPWFSWKEATTANQVNT